MTAVTAICERTWDWNQLSTTSAAWATAIAAPATTRARAPASSGRSSATAASASPPAIRPPTSFMTNALPSSSGAAAGLETSSRTRMRSSPRVPSGMNTATQASANWIWP